MRKFYDIDQNEIITQNQLFREYVEAVKRGEIDNLEISFEWYMHNCLVPFGGTLEEVTEN